MILRVDGDAGSLPMIQLFGNVFGQEASTWNFGTSLAKVGAMDSAQTKSDGTIFMSSCPDAGGSKPALRQCSVFSEPQSRDVR